MRELDTLMSRRGNLQDQISWGLEVRGECFLPLSSTCELLLCAIEALLMSPAWPPKIIR